MSSCQYFPDGTRIVSAPEVGDNALRIWDAQGGSEAAIFITGGTPSAIALGPAGRHIALGGPSGAVDLLRLKGFEFEPPLLTPVYLYRRPAGFSSRFVQRLLRSKRGSFDSKPTARCEWCGERFVPATIVLDAIRGIASCANLSGDQSPCAKLPAETWNDERLHSECPQCREPVRFNPFVVDNRDRY